MASNFGCKLWNFWSTYEKTDKNVWMLSKFWFRKVYFGSILEKKQFWNLTFIGVTWPWHWLKVVKLTLCSRKDHNPILRQKQTIKHVSQDHGKDFYNVDLSWPDLDPVPSEYLHGSKSKHLRVLWRSLESEFGMAWLLQASTSKYTGFDI